MTSPKKQPTEAHADLLTIIVTAEGVGLRPGENNTISPFAWPTIMRKMADRFEVELDAQLK